jgi:hypothetical protein
MTGPKHSVQLRLIYTNIFILISQMVKQLQRQVDFNTYAHPNFDLIFLELFIAEEPLIFKLIIHGEHVSDLFYGTCYITCQV